MTPPPRHEPARQQVEALQHHLRAHIRGKKGTLTRVSRAIGRGQDYLSKAFRGDNPLKIKDVFKIFVALGEDPRAFFDRHYPLGGVDLSRWAASPPVVDGLAVSFRDLLDDVRRRQAPPEPGEVVENARALLREWIHRQGWTQKAVSEALGWSPNVLGSALRHGTDLWALHVFATLQVLELSPARFWSELLWPEDAGPTRGELVQVLERLLAGAGRSAMFAGQPPPTKPDEDSRPAKASPDSRPAGRPRSRT